MKLIMWAAIVSVIFFPAGSIEAVTIFQGLCLVGLCILELKPAKGGK